MELLKKEHCYPKEDLGDCVGKVLVLDGDLLLPKQKQIENQLWLATHGKGCYLGYYDTTIHVTSLFDRSETFFHRNQFLGEVKEEFLPELAKLTCEELLPCCHNEDFFLKARPFPFDTPHDTRIYSEFENIVLTVHLSEEKEVTFGVWEYDKENECILNGISYGTDLEGAKVKFGVRSGLSSSNFLFNQEETDLLAKSLNFALEEGMKMDSFQHEIAEEILCILGEENDMEEKKGDFMRFLKKEHCELLIKDRTTKDDLRGKIVIFDEEKLNVDCKQPENQFCMVTGGSGCTLGYNDSTLLVTFMADETEDRICVDSCLGVPKEEFLPDWVKEKREHLAPEPIKNSEWFIKGKELPHELWGENRLLCEFDGVSLIVSRIQRNPYNVQCPEAHMQSKQEPAKISFNVAIYNENDECYFIYTVNNDIEVAKSDFAEFSTLVSPDNIVSPEEAIVLVKACETQLNLGDCTDYREELLLHTAQVRLSKGFLREELLDFEEESEFNDENLDR